MSIRTVDSDIVAIAVAACNVIKPDELWISYGTGNHHRYIAAHEIMQSMGPYKSTMLPVVHAFTGCNTVSAFSG